MVSDPTPLQFKRRVAALSAIFAVAAGLRLLQYAASNSLWLDELYVALNVTRSGWADLLFEPLAYNQVAPLGFLALEKLATSLLGNGELVLRFFPTFFSLISMILFWRVCTRFLEGGSLLVALGLFAINPVFLWTARNTKQYSGDIMVVLVLLLLALRFREGKNDIRSTIIAGVVGGLGILLSQPAV
ncbi:MAG TPA: glycosyltransferase family 39 protein, partial [Gemmatimonadota bacterium]|nr:glycosyltransferase family 39 protein [Gemmatimonadota bacterium]